MALNATIFKAELQVSNLDRHYYETHALTLARHPSETDERMMVRLLAFALHADAALAFGNGLSSADEPALWRKDLTGVILQWIDVGLPEVKQVRRAAGRAAEVAIYAYGRGADRWWAQSGAELEAIDALTVFKLPTATTQALAGLAQKNMRLQCLVQEGDVTFSDDQMSVTVAAEVLKASKDGQ
jgi:uncharacterized protein YaeQ